MQGKLSHISIWLWGTRILPRQLVCWNNYFRLWLESKNIKIGIFTSRNHELSKNNFNISR